MKGNVLLAGLLPLAVSALVAWQAERLPLRGPVIAPDAAPRDCQAPLTFRVAFPAGDADAPAPPTPPNPQNPSPQSHTFMGNSWLAADTCQAGTLRVVGEGQVAGGAAPRLQVALNSKVIWTGAFSEKREVLIPVPAPGHLTLGYFNDFYSTDYRNATLEQLRLESAACDTFDVAVPPEAGGSWNAQARSVGWLFAPPITLRPCAAGTLNFRASGRSGGGTSATLGFSQGGKEVRRLTLTEAPQELSLAVSAEPLEIRIVDPYFKELGDRNLSLREIEFSSAR